RRRAELYASALGMRVNRIVSVSESGGYAPPMPVAGERFAAARDAAATPAAPGEIETRVSGSGTVQLRQFAEKSRNERGRRSDPPPSDFCARCELSSTALQPAPQLTAASMAPAAGSANPRPAG